MSKWPEVDPRRSPRLPVEIVVGIEHPRSQQRMAADMTELTPEGCRLVASPPFEQGAQLLVELPGFEPWPARVIWAQDGALGAEFHDPLPFAVFERYADRFGNDGPA
jgi:hypothetical protein